MSLAEAKLNPQSITFSRWLVGEWLEQWESIIAELSKVVLCNRQDTICWRFSKKGLFSVCMIC